MREKFAWTDSSEDHFQAGLALRVKVCILLKITMVNNLVTVELTHGKKDRPKAPASYLTIYSSYRPTEAKEQVSVVKCSHQTDQALEVYSDHWTLQDATYQWLVTSPKSYFIFFVLLITWEQVGKPSISNDETLTRDERNSIGKGFYLVSQTGAC